MILKKKTAKETIGLSLNQLIKYLTKFDLSESEYGFIIKDNRVEKVLIGNDRRVKIKENMLKSNSEKILLHTHPDNSTFSLGDIFEFINDTFGEIILISNDKRVYSLKKNPVFNKKANRFDEKDFLSFFNLKKIYRKTRRTNRIDSLIITLYWLIIPLFSFTEVVTLILFFSFSFEYLPSLVYGLLIFLLATITIYLFSELFYNSISYLSLNNEFRKAQIIYIQKIRDFAKRNHLLFTIIK